MSVIATIDVAAEDVTFGGVLTVNPGLHVRLERVVPLGSTFIPYLWASDDSVEAIEAALRTEADLESFRIVDSVDGEALVRVEWAREVDGLLDVMADSRVTLLDGEGHADVWTFQLRFDDRDDLTAFYRQCADQGISLDLKRIHDPAVRADDGRMLDLTEAQREALELAYERGYFDVPRRIGLTELAAELGISDTAVSQRLRRGLKTLLSETLER